MYRKLYQIVENILEAHGTGFTISENVACAIYGKNPDVVDITEFDGFHEGEFLEYVYYRLLDGMPDEDAFEMFFSEEQLEQFKNEKALHLFIILSIIKTEKFLSSEKKLEGLEARWKQLRKAGEIGLLESIKLHSLEDKISFEKILYLYVLHPVRNMLPGKLRKR